MASTIHHLEKQNRALADKERKSESVLVNLKQGDSVRIRDIEIHEQIIAKLVLLVNNLTIDNDHKRSQLEGISNSSLPTSSGGEFH